MKSIEVLMVDDNPGDVMLVMEAVHRLTLPYHISVARDGVEAIDHLRRLGRHAAAPRPHVIILDLKLPRMNGREVLQDIEIDHDLRRIPLVVLSSSRSELDLAKQFAHAGRTFMVKPGTFQEYTVLLTAVEAFRLTADAAKGVPS